MNLTNCRHYEQQRRYWLDRGVPGPPASIVFGNLKSLIDNNYPAPLKYRDWTKQYGSTYGILEGANRILVSSDLDVLHDVFVKKFEHFHGRKVSEYHLSSNLHIYYNLSRR